MNEDKSILGGNEALIPADKWQPFEKMNNEEKILNNDIFNIAFEQIIEKYKPNKKLCLISLCTKTRPYIKSRKWKTFDDLFSNHCDLIVISNGGIIPRPYWNSYPFLNYDGPGEKETTELYNTKLYNRLKIFFKHIKYDYVVVNFRTNQRNYIPAKKAFGELKEDGYIKDYEFAPIEETHKLILNDKSHSMMFPDVHPLALKELTSALEQWSEYEEIDYFS